MEGKKVKEKTRDLAHSRRKKENDTFTDIAQSLPIQENAKDLDKASILRVAIHYLKLRDMIRDGGEESPDQLTEEQLQAALDLSGNGGAPPLGELLPEHLQFPGAGQPAGDVGSPSSSSQSSDVSSTPSEPLLSDILPNFSKDVLQALDGFMMVVSRDGRILYVSESIANYLGLRQVDVIGVHVQELIHPQDCSEVAAIFQTQGHDIDQIFDAKDPMRRKFVVRMRCAFTPSVRSITRCSNFKPIYCSCFLKFARSGPNVGQFTGIVALCKLASIPRLKEMVVGTFFKTKHALDLSYTAIDTRIRWILGYDPSEMVGLKAYQYFHPEDLTSTSSCHMNLLSRGRSHSPCYRFLSHWGDWIWVRSKSHMIFNNRSQLPEAIVIYTWIVRIDEEDERMKAIKAGDSGEDKVKKYEPFDSEMSSGNGKLDITSLADPLAPAGTGLNEAPAPIKTIKQESSPPPADIVESGASPKDLITPPSSIMGDIKSAYQGSPPGDILSPQSDVSDCPPNVNPFSTSPPSSLTPADTVGHYQSSPEHHRTSFSHSGGSPAEVVDQTTLFSQQQLQHHSFMPSPPYTPYNNNSPSGPAEMQQFPSTSIGYESNGSPYNMRYTNTPPSNGSPVMNPLPLNSYKMRRSLSPSESSSDGAPYGNTSPPFSTTNMPQGFPLVGAGAGAVPPSHSQAPPTFQPGDPVAFGYSAPSFIPASVVHSSTAPPHVVSMSVGTPSPSMEMPATFYTHGSAITYQPNAFGDVMNVAGSNLTDLQFVNETTHVLGSNFSARSVPQGRLRQTVINDARTRYSGVMPSGHFGHGNNGRSHIGGNDREMESISQWSQWLKNGAPTGPAAPVY